MHNHEADDTLLAMFQQLGVNLQTPREVIFYFAFPTEPDADNAVRSLTEKKLSAEKLRIDPPWWKRLFAKPRWAVAVTREMPLDESKIKKITTLFQQIATSHNGDYDGWEANVMDAQLDTSQLDNLQK